MYHAFWADWYLPAAMPVLEALFFRHLQPGAKVLDVCCGPGHVTKELVRRGYIVTGIDSSPQLIAIARRELPGADLRVQDARQLNVGSDYNAALSTFDSLNHILTLDDLQLVFSGVHAALESGGRFVFDMNLEEAYSADLREWSIHQAHDEMGLVRGVYDYATKSATTELIWFRRAANECWHRTRSIVEECCYEEVEIFTALREAGFRDIESVNARDAGMASDIGWGRIFVTARA